MKILISLLIIVFFVEACSKDKHCGCFDSNGDIAIENRALSSFHEIEIDNVFDITIHIDSVPRISIETGKHLFKGIETEIENNRLYIKNNNTCNWVRNYNGKIKLEIYTNELTYIRLNESCDIKSKDTIITNEIRVDDYADISTFDLWVKCSTITFALHAGTGDITLRGNASTGYFWSMGYGNFHFYEFPTDYCYIMSNTTGNCYVNVEKEIEATIKNSGNIYYSGDPYKINTTRTGSGNLIKN
jgi:hypothetical protein